jgi:hypothetical protein
VSRFDGVLETIAGNVGVNLRGRNIGMTQQRLNASEIGPAFD